MSTRGNFLNTTSLNHAIRFYSILEGKRNVFDAKHNLLRAISDLFALSYSTLLVIIYFNFKENQATDCSQPVLH